MYLLERTYLNMAEPSRFPGHAILISKHHSWEVKIVQGLAKTDFVMRHFICHFTGENKEMMALG